MGHRYTCPPPWARELNSVAAGLKTKDIVDFLRENEVEGFENDYNQLFGMEKRSVQIKQLMKLNKGFLEKLEVAGYIIRERVGRYNTIKITESGRYIASISELYNL